MYIKKSFPVKSLFPEGVTTKDSVAGALEQRAQLREALLL